MAEALAQLEAEAQKLRALLAEAANAQAEAAPSTSEAKPSTKVRRRPRGIKDPHSLVIKFTTEADSEGAPPTKPNARGAYHADVRARAIVLRSHKVSGAAAAHRLGVSRSTVHRWWRAFEEEGKAGRAPEEQKRPGSKPTMDREALYQLTALVERNPRATVAELRDAMLVAGTLPRNPRNGDAHISEDTVRRTLHRVGLRHGRVQLGKGRRPKHMRRRAEFQAEQRTTPALATDFVVAFDETTLDISSMVLRGWGRDATLKGQTGRVRLLLAIGAPPPPFEGTFVHYKFVFDVGTDGPILHSCDKRLHLKSFSDLGLDQTEKRPAAVQAQYVSHVATRSKAELREFLVACEVRTTYWDEAFGGEGVAEEEVRIGQEISREIMRNLAVRISIYGRRGLPRRGRLRRVPNTEAHSTKQTVTFIHELKAALAEDGRYPKDHPVTLLLDNASYHGATRAEGKISWMHDVGAQLGFASVYFTPPLSPEFNPTEAANAWIKARLRKGAPYDGQVGFLDAISRVVRDLRRSSHGERWFAACGYRPLYDIQVLDETGPEAPPL
jgi:transposase